MRNKTKFKNTFPLPLPASWAKFTVEFSTSSPERHRGTGNGGYSQFITCCLCHSFLLRGGLLTLCPCSSVGPTHGGQSSKNCSSMSPSHRLQLFTNCSSVGTPKGHKPYQQTCSSLGSSLHGSTGPGRSLLQRGLPRGPLWASTYSIMASSTGCRWISAPPWTSMGCRGTACLTMIFSTGCPSAPVPGAPPLPPSSLTLVSAEQFLSHILPPLS